MNIVSKITWAQEGEQTDVGGGMCGLMEEGAGKTERRWSAGRRWGTM